MPENESHEISPTIPIRDPLGVEIGVIGRGPLLELFSGVSEFVVGVRNGTLANLIRNPQALIDQTEVEALSTELKFEEPLNLVEVSGGRHLEYFVDAGIQARIEFLASGSPLNGGVVKAGELYTVLHLCAQLDAGVSVPIPIVAGVTVSPGLRGGFGLRLAHARRRSDETPAFELVTGALSGFSFPFNPRRIRSLIEGEFISWRTEATLAFSARVSWGLSSNILIDDIDQLAGLDPALRRAQVLGSDLNLNSPVAASADLEFVYGITDVFDFKVRKLSGDQVQVEVSPAQEEFRQVGFDFTVGLVGLPGALEDQIATYLGRQFDQLSSSQLGDWATSLLGAAEDALIRRAKLQLKAAFRKTGRRSSTFEFVFDLSSPIAGNAYAFAVEGDLTKAIEAARDENSGVRQTFSAFESLNRETLDLTFNFVGVLNFTSQQELASRSRVEVDPFGELSIIHERSFKAMEELPGHLRIADFLFKAAWNRGERQSSVSRDFNFEIHYAFTEEEQFTSRREIEDVLCLGVALDLLTEDEKVSILKRPVEFSRVLNWPLLGELTPEDTFGTTLVYVRTRFSEAGLQSILEKTDDEVWEAFSRGFQLANPRSPNSRWLDKAVQKEIEEEGWAEFIASTNSSERHRRLRIVWEYQKAKQFRKTLRVFRKALAKGVSGAALLQEMAEANKAARKFRFDRAAYVALNLLSPSELRETTLVIDGEKINGQFSNFHLT